MYYNRYYFESMLLLAAIGAWPLAVLPIYVAEPNYKEV